MAKFKLTKKEKLRSEISDLEFSIKLLKLDVAHLKKIEKKRAIVRKGQKITFRGKEYKGGQFVPDKSKKYWK